MTTYELRATARELTQLHHRFAPLFGRKEAQAQSLVYLNGLLLASGRKSDEPMALAFGQADDEGISQNQASILRNRLGKDSHLRQTEVSVTKGFQFEREGSRTWRLIRVVVLFQIKVADTVSF